MAFSEVSAGRFTAAVTDRVVGPRIQRRATPVIFMAGGGATAADSPFGDCDETGEALVANGFRVFQPSVPWLLGNPTSVTRIDNALTYAHANGCAGPPILVGQSNGSACAFRWARANPAAAVIAVLPPLDAQALYEADTLSLRSDYETAFAITYPTPIPDAGNPITGIGDYDCPIQLHYASNDDVSLLTVGDGTAVEAFTVGGAEAHSVGALGHTATACHAVDPDLVIEFLAGFR